MAKPFIAIGILFFICAGMATYYGYHRYLIQHQGTWKPSIEADIRNKWRAELYDHLLIDSNDIVFIGTSLTENFPLTEMSGNLHVKNRGIGWNTTQHIAGRLNGIILHHPKVIFIEGGINDLIKGDSVIDIYDRYVGIIDSINRHSPKTRIVVQSLIPINKQSEHYHLLPSIIRLNVLIEEDCQIKNLRYIDLFNALLKDNNLPSAYTWDGLHLNSQGYAIWYHRIAPFIY